MFTSIPPGHIIETVFATDMDDSASPAGMLEYRIINGGMQLGVEMFSFPDPSVSVAIVLFRLFFFSQI